MWGAYCEAHKRGVTRVEVRGSEFESDPVKLWPETPLDNGMTIRLNRHTVNKVIKTGVTKHKEKPAALSPSQRVSL
jgi:hypothetical protein